MDHTNFFISQQSTKLNLNTADASLTGFNVQTITRQIRRHVRLDPLDYDLAEEAQSCPSLRYKAESFLPAIDRFIGSLVVLLVRLRSTWDRRLVLGGRRKLSESDDFRRRLYISSDESPEVRRRSTLQILAKGVERYNKKVDNRDGILKIDDVIVYTLKDGFVKSVNCSSSSSSG